MRLWIKDPIAILSQGAERGVVVEDGVIVELVASGKEPMLPVDQTFDASRHVITPGLVNTHHHFFQTLTRAHPQAINKELFPWLQTLYPIWAKNVKPDNFRLGSRLALTELMMSGCTAASDHHYLFPDGLEEAMDIQAEEAERVGVRMTITRKTINFVFICMNNQSLSIHSIWSICSRRPRTQNYSRDTTRVTMIFFWLVKAITHTKSIIHFFCHLVIHSR